MPEQDSSSTPTWLQTAVREFGISAKEKLSGPGDPEANIRTPIEHLLGAAGGHLGVTAVFHDETALQDRGVRPDYAVSINGVISGYVEIKAPNKSIHPETFRGHDKTQWERQRDLPNLIYTNGHDWLLYRDGEEKAAATLGGGTLRTAGADLSATVGFESLLRLFVQWEPQPITNVSALVRAIAPLTRLVRGEVLDQLAIEKRNIAAGQPEHAQPFRGLAAEWRRMLFPEADDHVFADGYAQTVTFGLLLAKSEGQTVTPGDLHAVGNRLAMRHGLIGRALQLLTDYVQAEFRVSLDLLTRVINAVDWPRIRQGRRDIYLHLYENFLSEYDPGLRKKSGSYYTPREVVDGMVRFTELVLQDRLGRPQSFLDPQVVTIDPAMGTGTYLHSIIDRAATQAENTSGPGAVAGAITSLARRLIGFEWLIGPYAIAELRTVDLLKTYQANSDGLRLFVTNTLDDPTVEVETLHPGLVQIAESRREANLVKANENVTVVIGNPPYGENAKGRGGWVENGSAGAAETPLIDDFHYEGTVGNQESNLRNLYAYFWRWATWKVWESSASVDGDAGIVCFITPSSYLKGAGHRGMRRYLRRMASEGWVIDLTPEGKRPPANTAVFAIETPVSIGVFVRRHGKDPLVPATVHHTTLSGLSAAKARALGELPLDGEPWRLARSNWTAPFLPQATSDWDEYPALTDLFPWGATGIGPNRRWVYSPSPEVLRARWRQIVAEQDGEAKSKLFKETHHATLDRAKEPLAGADTYKTTTVPFRNETGAPPEPAQVGYRAFDRQWILPDSRLMHTPSTNLWAARQADQVFIAEQHAHVFGPGPSIAISSEILDKDYFDGRGGRIVPLLHPDGSANLAHGLLNSLSESLGVPVSAEDFLAYSMAILGHPGFRETFLDELTTPGIRLPITADPSLWAEALELGRTAIWASTFGLRASSTIRPLGHIRLDPNCQQRPLCQSGITEMPESLGYDESTESLLIGDGRFSPVTSAVRDYEVGGRNVLDSWFGYRKARPSGRKSSPLDEINATSWPSGWTEELLDLLSVLTRLVDLEPQQQDLLVRILGAELLTMKALADCGVRWPVTRRDRNPRYPLDQAELEN